MPPRGGAWWWAAAALVLAALGAWIIREHPVIWWWDGFHRLYQRDDLVVWRWLPLLQSFIFAVTRVTYDVEAVRAVLVAIASAAVLAGGFCAARLFGRGAGALAAFGVATSSTFVVLATVPYQEPLFALLLFLFFGARVRGGGNPDGNGLPPDLRSGSSGLAIARRIAVHRCAPEPVGVDLTGSAGCGPAALGWGPALCLNLACLTRYEGWLLTAVVAGGAVVGRLRRGSLRLAARDGALVVLLGGGIPIGLWLALAPIDVNPHESAFLDRLAPDALARGVVGFGAQTIRQLQPAAAVLAAIGLWRGLRRRRPGDGQILLLAFAAADTAMALVIDPLPGSRRTFVVEMLLIPCAAFGAVEAFRGLRGFAVPRLGPARARALAAAALAVPLLWIPAAGLRNGLADCAHFAANADRVAHREAALWIRENAAGRPLVLAEDENARRTILVYSGLEHPDVLAYGNDGTLDLRALAREAAPGRPVCVVLTDSTSRLARDAAALRAGHTVNIESRTVTRPPQKSAVVSVLGQKW